MSRLLFARQSQRKGIMLQVYRNISQFTLRVKTDNAGTSGSTQFTIPTTGAGYNYTVVSIAGITSGITGDHTVTFPAAGTYTIEIRGTFPRIYFNNGGDRLKLLEIKAWGEGAWGATQTGAFYGCANLVGNYIDKPNFGNVTNMTSMFRVMTVFNSPLSLNTAKVTNMSFMFSGTTAFNSLLSLNTAKVNTMSYMFNNCTAFNQSVANFDTAKVTNMSYMFHDCTNFNQDISHFNISSGPVSTMANMLNSSGMSAENYSKYLISCANQVSAAGVPKSISLGASGCKYNSTNYGGTPYNNAVDARAYLVLATGSGGAGWTITDGGAV
jgi:surface protein